MWFTRKENETQAEQPLNAEEILQAQDISRRNNEEVRKLERETSQCARRCFCECGSICER